MPGRRFTKPDSEAIVHERIVRYLKRDHPRVVFKTDFSAGLKLPIWLAARQRKLQYKRGFPDLVVYQGMELLRGALRAQAFGLCIEIKKGGTRLKKLDGLWSSDHIREQYEMLQELDRAGYACAFAVGYDQAVDIIEAYFNGKFYELPWQDFSLQQYKTPELVHEQGPVF